MQGANDAIAANTIVARSLKARRCESLVPAICSETRRVQTSVGQARNHCEISRRASIDPQSRLGSQEKDPSLSHRRCRARQRHNPIRHEGPSSDPYSRSVGGIDGALAQQFVFGRKGSLAGVEGELDRFPNCRIEWCCNHDDSSIRWLCIAAFEYTFGHRDNRYDPCTQIRAQRSA